MFVVNAFFDFVGTWFGFVGACVASPTGACVPFLAFFALGFAAGTALVLLLLAYRAAGHGARGEMPSESSQHHAKTPRERTRARPPVTGNPVTA